jgi:hypothetical protein
MLDRTKDLNFGGDVIFLIQLDNALFEHDFQNAKMIRVTMETQIDVRKSADSNRPDGNKVVESERWSDAHPFWEILKGSGSGETRIEAYRRKRRALSGEKMEIFR